MRWSIPLLLLGGCLADNPDWGEADTEGPGSSGSTTTSGATSPTSASVTSTGSTTDSSSTSGGSTGGSGDLYADAVLEDAPLAYWRFGEDVTPTAVDEMGNFPGEYQGSVVLGERGLVASDNGAVRLGFGTRIVFGDVLDLPGDPSISIEAWIQPDFTDESWPKIIHNKGGDAQGAQGYSMEISPDGRLSCALHSDDEWTGVNAPIPMEETSHVVMTHDGVTARLYVNGEEVSSFTNALPLRETDSPFVIGSNNVLPDGGSHFYGVVDEIAIYDHPLPPQRISAHYAIGLGQ